MMCSFGEFRLVLSTYFFVKGLLVGCTDFYMEIVKEWLSLQTEKVKIIRERNLMSK